MKFHVGHVRGVAVPAGRDVAVRALHDHEQLALSEAVDQIVGPADVADDREVVAVLIEQHGVVRGDESVVGGADERHPRIRVDQPAEFGDIRHREAGVLAHAVSLRADSDRAHAWQDGHQ